MSAASDFSEAFERYRRDIDHASNERQRAQYFIEFLRSLPDLDDEMQERIGYPTDIRPELEEHLTGQKAKRNRELTEWIDGETTEPSDGEAETVFVDVSGRLDARVGNLVIEFKNDLNADQDDAEQQLREYVFMLHSKGMEEDFLCLATDGERFVTYETLLSEPVESDNDVVLNELAHLSMETAEPSQIKRWLSGLLSERVHPVVEELDDVFGVDSETFERSLEILERAYEESERADVHRQEWADYLTYAQGESPDEQVQLYLRQTYLASFAKLLSYMVFTRGSMPGIDDGKEVLSGEITAPFPENLFEQDLFSWVGHTDAGDEFVELLLDRLLQFNLGRVDQDVFKRLYQDMVSYDVRHDLGEYYTPDWLAEYMLRQKMDIDADDMILDPGCGSGTFLVEALQLKIDESDDDPEELISRIPEEVVGFDIHPLAVMIAKANYVAAIRDLLQYRRERIQLPVYLADSVLFDEELRDTQTLDGAEVRGPIRIAGEEYYLPQKAIENPQDFDEALDIMADFIDDGEGFEWRLAQNVPEFEDVTSPFERIRESIEQAAQEDRDSIHAFILKNFFRPLYLAGNVYFDAVIGNPPYLSYRYMGERQQDQTKQLLSDYGLHPGPQNVTHMEEATLFVARCADLYLGDSKQLGFVMPRSIFTSDQHDPFRRGDYDVQFGLTRVIDLEDVDPLFNIPACVIIGQKGIDLDYPIDKTTLSGSLNGSNLSWDEAGPQFDIEEGELYLHGNGVTSWDEVPNLSQSDYHPDFYQGATIVPRPLFFVQPRYEEDAFGLDGSSPALETSDYAYENTKRDEYEVRLTGEIESEFLYATLLGGDVTPFTNRDFRTVVLPIVPNSSEYSIIDAESAKAGGNPKLASWLENAREVWNKTDGRVDSLEDQLNYRQKLTRQNPNARYRVLYLASGTNLAGCVVTAEELNKDSPIPVQDVVVDHKTYFYETNDGDEAYYLSAVINSGVLNDSIENLQSRGEFGARDIHKLPFEFPVPQFNPDNEDHMRLAELGRECEEEAEDALSDAEDQYKATWRIREVVRDALEDELAEIDEIVDRLFEAEMETQE
jgi:type I restriction-modification system DNA methylase subunit